MVARLMGHAAADVTLNVYTQVLDDAMCAVDRVGTESIDGDVSTARADVQTMGPHRMSCP